MAPIVPTMKYWKTLLPVSPPLVLYFLKLGIFVVSLPDMPLKGLSNDEVLETSETLRRCWVATATAARAVDGNCWRAHRARVPAVAVRADMMGARVNGCWSEMVPVVDCVKVVGNRELVQNALTGLLRCQEISHRPLTLKLHPLSHLHSLLKNSVPIKLPYSVPN